LFPWFLAQFNCAVQPSLYIGREAPGQWIMNGASSSSIFYPQTGVDLLPINNDYNEDENAGQKSALLHIEH
jgi:hypothetical protein